MWSPDGQWIAFVKTASGWPDLRPEAWWVVRSDGSDERLLIGEREQESLGKEESERLPPGWDSILCWVGGKPWALVLGYGGERGAVGEPGLYLVDVNGRTAKRIDVGGGLWVRPIMCSRDGKHLYISVSKALEGPICEYYLEFTGAG